MDVLGLNETENKLAEANGVRWCGYKLRREEDDVLRGALHNEVTCMVIERENDLREHREGKWRRPLGK